MHEPGAKKLPKNGMQKKTGHRMMTRFINGDNR